MADTNVGEIIYALLTAAPSVTALVATRVYPNELPQGSELPAIVYTVVSDVPESSLDGSIESAVQGARVQVDCYARPDQAAGAYKRVHAVSNAVKSLLGNLSNTVNSGFFESERDMFDNATQYHRVSMDFTIWR